MRVGIVTVSYLPRLGGAVTQTLLLHKFLSSKGHQVEVFCPDLARRGRFQEDNIIVNRIHNPLIRNFHGTLARIAIIHEFRRTINSRRKDFDVFITPEFNLGPLSLSLTRGTKRIAIYGADLTFEFLNLNRTNSIISYDDVLARKPSRLGFVNYINATILSTVQNFMFRRLDCTVALNPKDFERIRVQTPRVVQIGCLLEPPPFCSELEKKPRRVPQLVTIVGRAVSWKKIPESIRVAERLKEVYPHLEIHYFGTGPLMRDIEREFKDRVVMHKDLSNAQVLDWLMRSDITVNMSDYETFCLTNCEAMLNRSLLLVKPLAAYGEYIRDQENCVLVSNPDAPHWLKRVQESFQTGRVRDLLNTAQQTIVDQYRLEKTGAQIEQLLTRTAEAQPGLQTPTLTT